MRIVSKLVIFRSAEITLLVDEILIKKIQEKLGPSKSVLLFESACLDEIDKVCSARGALQSDTLSDPKLPNVPSTKKDLLTPDEYNFRLVLPRTRKKNVLKPEISV